ncbi:hypothetical protein [Acrocarpospora phusangensis]|uniref:hypothetical protein n=1 Tax=Acrocarpospora phusangensis TaxID=1070424 RepID=UPI0019527BA4|nr:hypothetical protein [Acrocarpospora phusangensis]
MRCAIVDAAVDLEPVARAGMQPSPSAPTGPARITADDLGREGPIKGLLDSVEMWAGRLDRADDEDLDRVADEVIREMSEQVKLYRR